MNWIINIFFLVFITSLTGTFMQLVWLAGRKLFGHKNPVAVYMGLRFVCLGYLIPVVYLLTWVCFQGSFYAVADNDRNHIMRKVLPSAPPMVEKAVFYIAILWLVMSCIVLCRYLFQYIRKKWYQKLGYREQDTEILERLRECQERLSIKKMPKVYRSDRIYSPLCMGVFSKIIMLPVREYSAKELNVIFMHELTHIKHYDLEFKLLSILVMIVHSFNPPAHFLLRQISIWGEIKCDILTCDKSEEIFSTKEYYSIILNMITDKKDKNIKDSFITALAEKSTDIIKRISCMKQYKKAERKSKKTTAGVIAAVLIASSTVSFAAGTISLNYYDKFIKDNFSIIYEKDVQKLKETVTNMDKTWNLIDMTDSSVYAEGAGYAYDWELNSMDTYTIQKVYCQKGTIIKVDCVFNEDSDEIIVAGIIEPDDTTIRSVEHVKYLSHQFVIEEDGYYSIFVRNTNASMMDVHFVYYLL